MTTPVIQLIRVSTEGQAADERAGLARQEAACRLAATRYDLAVVRSVVLVDVSGDKVAETPEWQGIVVELNNGTARGILVDAVDRLLRATAFDFRVFRDLCAARANIYTPDGPKDPADDNDGLLLGLLAMVGGRERREILRRAQAGKEAKRRRGEWVLPAAFLPKGVGYDRSQPVGERWHYTAEIAEVVACFEAYASGTTSLRQLAKRYGLHDTVLRQRLENHLYRGWLVIDERYTGWSKSKRSKRAVPRPEHEVIRVEVLRPGAVSEDLFTAVQRELGRTRDVYFSRVEARDPDNYPWLYRGMLVCASCGTRLDTVSGSHGDPARYRCAAAHRQGKNALPIKCRAGSIMAPKLEDLLDELFVERLARPEVVATLLAVHVAAATSDHSASERTRLEEQVRSLEAKRAKLLSLYLESTSWSPVELDAEKVTLDSQLRRARADLGTVELRSPNPLRDLAGVAERIAAAFVGFSSLARSAKRELIERLRPSITVDKILHKHRIEVTRVDLHLGAVLDDSSTLGHAPVLTAVGELPTLTPTSS